jgi:hypothetical protein
METVDSAMARLLAAGMALAASLVLVSGARAQAPFDGSAYAFPVPDYVSTIVATNTLGPPAGRSGTTKPKKHARPVKHATTRQLRSLRYAPSASVTQSVYQRVVDQVGASVDPATLQAQLVAAKAQFRSVLGKLGWSPTDLGDMAAFAFLQGYVTWRENGVVPKGALGPLRRQVRDDLARQRSVRRLSDARKQVVAEILELRTIFFLDSRNAAAAAGDAAGVAIARAQMRDWIEDVYGVDVDDVKLTRHGVR